MHEDKDLELVFPLHEEREKTLFVGGAIIEGIRRHNVRLGF